jgi:hypothetical protein
VLFTSALLSKLCVEISVVRHVADRELTSLKKTALLVTQAFQPIAFARIAFAMAAVGAALLVHMGVCSSELAWLPLALLLVGEILERSLFFRAVDAPKMPGNLPA